MIKDRTDSAETLEHYMDVEYPVEIQPMEHSDGGYYARMPDFGRAAVHADGPTVEAALRELQSVKRLVLEVMLGRGDPIPEPYSRRNTYSGRFQVRVPKSLHQKLAQEAEREGVSLNMLVVSKLSR